LKAFALGLSLMGCLTFFVPGAWAKKEIPAAPYYYVLDEPSTLSDSAREKVQSLLIEHDRLTGEQIVVAIFKSLEGKDLVEFSNRVFESWAIGKRGKDNGILLALFWDDRKARIEVGYGLEPLLTDAKAKEIIEDVLIPPLRAKDPDSAIASSVLALLDTIGSPLVENGKAQQRLQSIPRHPIDAGTGGGIIFLMLLGICFFIFVVYTFSKAEAHFTRRGWYRPNPFLRSGGWWGGGGFGGGGGGFGGFSGGGGRSGGGGASGSW